MCVCVQYGALKYVDEERFPLFAVKSKHWDAAKPSVLVTGGVHGEYKTTVTNYFLFRLLSFISQPFLPCGLCGRLCLVRR